ncbi:MAG: hypothetical protein ACFCU5_11440 [Pleurocapsa sp.]
MKVKLNLTLEIGKKLVTLHNSRNTKVVMKDDFDEELPPHVLAGFLGEEE